jgi:erythromycin esterase
MSRSDDLPDRLDDRAVPLTTDDPEAGLDDLRPLADALDGATVVGLGEATHGTREFFRFKHRIVRFLVEERGVRLFGLESNFAETMAINDYVVRGEGDPEEALRGIYFWTWNTEEVLALVEWLREFNDGRDEDDRVKFYGFDAQFTAGPAEAVREYLESVDPEFLDAERETLEMLADEGLRSEDGDEVPDSRLNEAEAFVSSLADRLEERKEAYVAETSESAWEVVSRHVRTIEQAVEQRATMVWKGRAAMVEARDAHMAENASWILDRESADRIALWAHNGHVKTGESRGHWGIAETMGERLRREFGDEYYALGFEFGRGSLQSLPDPDADGETELREFTVEEPFEGGLAETLSELGRPSVFLDFESAAGDPRVAEWLTGDHRLHSIGAFFYEDPEKNRSRYALRDELDGLLYVDETGRAVPVGGDSAT